LEFIVVVEDIDPYRKGPIALVTPTQPHGHGETTYCPICLGVSEIEGSFTKFRSSKFNWETKPEARVLAAIRDGDLSMGAYELEDVGQDYKPEDTDTDFEDPLEMEDDPIPEEEFQWLIADEQSFVRIRKETGVKPYGTGRYIYW
jgi:hypothetical protein